MRFHHMAVFVTDLQEAIHLWRDVMGFDLVVETEIPDGPAPGPKTYMYPKLLDDIFKVKDARSKMARRSSGVMSRKYIHGMIGASLRAPLAPVPMTSKNMRVP